MRGDLPEWALRLSTELPRHTHEAHSSYGVEKRGGDTTGLSRKRIITGRGRGGHNKRAITVDGVEYESLDSMVKALGIGRKTAYNWLDCGRAKR